MWSYYISSQQIYTIVLTHKLKKKKTNGLIPFWVRFITDFARLKWWMKYLRYTCIPVLYRLVHPTHILLQPFFELQLINTCLPVLLNIRRLQFHKWDRTAIRCKIKTGLILQHMQKKFWKRIPKLEQMYFNENKRWLVQQPEIEEMGGEWEEEIDSGASRRTSGSSGVRWYWLSREPHLGDWANMGELMWDVISKCTLQRATSGDTRLSYPEHAPLHC